MNNRNFILSLSAVLAITACGQSANGELAQDESADAVEAGTAGAVVYAAITGVYKSEPKHRYITFSYLHQGLSYPMLRWRDWDATLNWNAENPEASSVSVTIDVNSIDSGVDEYDGHLKSDKFFDVANNSEITFVSTGLSKTSDTTGTMTGDLTIKGNTKPVTLDVTFHKAAFDERNNIYKIGFSATGAVKRTDFGVDLYVPYVGDDVDVTISAEFVMAAE